MSKPAIQFRLNLGTWDRAEVIKQWPLVQEEMTKMIKQIADLQKELKKAKKVINEKDAMIAEKDAKINELQFTSDSAVFLARQAKVELEEKTTLKSKLKKEEEENTQLIAKLKRSGKAGRKNIADNLVIGDMLPVEDGLPRFKLTALKYTFKNEKGEDVTKPAKVKCVDCDSKNEFRLNQRRTHKCAPDLTCKKCKYVLSSAQTMRNHIHKKHGDTQWSGKQTDYFKTEEFKNLYKVLVQ